MTQSNNVRIPEPKDVIFLVSDEVRVEQGNKLALLGLYSANHIILNPQNDGKEDKIQFYSLVFTVIIRNASGRLPVEFSVVDNRGEAVVQKESDTIDFELDRGHSHILKVAPANFPAVGTYTMKFKIGDDAFESDLRISRRSS